MSRELPPAQPGDTVVSYEWCNQTFASLEAAREARESSSLTAIVGDELAGPIRRTWSDGVRDTCDQQRAIIVGVRQESDRVDAAQLMALLWAKENS